MFDPHLPLLVLFIAILISFILDPIAGLIQRVHMPRTAAVLLAMILCLTILYLGIYLSYGQATEMVRNLPDYSYKLRRFVLHMRENVEAIQNTTARSLPAMPETKAVAGRYHDTAYR